MQASPSRRVVWSQSGRANSLEPCASNLRDAGVPYAANKNHQDESGQEQCHAPCVREQADSQLTPAPNQGAALSCKRIATASARAIGPCDARARQCVEGQSPQARARIRRAFCCMSWRPANVISSIAISISRRSSYIAPGVKSGRVGQRGNKRTTRAHGLKPWRIPCALPASFLSSPHQPIGIF